MSELHAAFVANQPPVLSRLDELLSLLNEKLGEEDFAQATTLLHAMASAEFSAGLYHANQPAPEPPLEPPVNVDVPHATQEGDVVNCTMGNWTGEPTGYAYAWQSDGVDTGDGTNPYAVTAGDVGKTITCIVTASNAAGSTAAPASNGVFIPEPESTQAHAQRHKRH